MVNRSKSFYIFMTRIIWYLQYATLKPPDKSLKLIFQINALAILINILAMLTRTKQLSTFAEVSVVDTGIGIRENAMEELFSLDDRLTTRGTQDEKGSGLRLVICKEFVEKNGGRICAKSAPGKGSTFSFTLPLFVG
jgi:signal transduction histidine kinase